MNYEEKIYELLQKNMTENTFNFWKEANNKIPKIWDRPTSSTLKYHKKEDGRVPSVGEHTYEMLYACIKIWQLFGIQKRTKEGDILLLAISLHDAFKYGKNPVQRDYTDNEHDKLIGDLVLEGKNTFLKFMEEDHVNLLEECVRFHSGRWSTDATSDFNFKNYHPYTMFIHILDMFSSRNLIKVI